MLKHRKENLRAIRYTQEHRKAYKQVEKELLGHNTWRSLVHDLDKVILYNFLKFEKVKKFHRNTARHHENKLKKTTKRFRTTCEVLNLIFPFNGGVEVI